MGASYFVHTNQAVTHADRIYVQDLLESATDHEIITEEAYNELKLHISSNYKLKSI